MSVEIWNTYELALASGIGVFVGAVPVAALMILKRWDGSREAATARGWWEKAIAVQAENDRARWAPAYSPNLFADPDMTGEVVAEEVHDLLALTAEPHDDTDDDGNPGPDERTDGMSWWGWPLLAVVVLVVVALIPVWLTVLAVDLFREQSAKRRERRTSRLAEVVAAEEFADELRAMRADTEICAEIVAQPYEGRRLLDEHSVRDLSYRSRHTAAGYETGIFPAINVPAQRTGDEQ